MLRQSDSGGKRFSEHGSLGYFLFPPAGLRGRTAAEVMEAAWAWMHADVVVQSAGLCERCSAAIEQSVAVCDDHDATAGYCDRCGRRHAVMFRSHCPNCNRRKNSIATVGLLSATELLAFLTERGLNPIDPENPGRALRALVDYDEEVRSIDPLEVDFTFTVEGDAITLTLDDDLDVVDARRHAAADA